MSDDYDEAVQKRVAFYSNIVNAWVLTRLELDKTLITISSAGIGFLVTFSKEISSTNELLAYCMAFGFFLIAICLCLAILHKNSSYIEDLIHKGQEIDARNKTLSRLDLAARVFFAIALAVTVIIGASMGYKQLQNVHKRGGELKMTEANEKKNPGHPTFDSYSRLNTLETSEDCQKSYKGLNNLAPVESSGKNGPQSSEGNAQQTTQAPDPKKK